LRVLGIDRFFHQIYFEGFLINVKMNFDPYEKRLGILGFTLDKQQRLITKVSSFLFQNRKRNLKKKSQKDLKA
jgi:hypothetical protein